MPRASFFVEGVEPVSEIKDEAVMWFTEQIHQLHELGFSLNEEKDNGAEFVPITDYEYLLNWVIERMQSIRDDVEVHGDDLVPRVCNGTTE